MIFSFSPYSEYTAASIGANKTSTVPGDDEAVEPLVDMFLNPQKLEAMTDEIKAMRNEFTDNLRKLDLDQVVLI